MNFEQKLGNQKVLLSQSSRLQAMNIKANTFKNSEKDLSDQYRSANGPVVISQQSRPGSVNG